MLWKTQTSSDTAAAVVSSPVPSAVQVSVCLHLFFNYLLCVRELSAVDFVRAKLGS